MSGTTAIRKETVTKTTNLSRIVQTMVDGRQGKGGG